MCDHKRQAAAHFQNAHGAYELAAIYERHYRRYAFEFFFARAEAFAQRAHEEQVKGSKALRTLNIHRASGAQLAECVKCKERCEFGRYLLAV